MEPNCDQLTSFSGSARARSGIDMFLHSVDRRAYGLKADIRKAFADYYEYSRGKLCDASITSKKD
jgi:hypothetical protein